MMTSHDRKALTVEELRTLEGLLIKLDGAGADLPWPLFRFINEVVATANIDLLVRDESEGVLLAWRDDPFGTGWHVPGSIIRHREEISHRIAACAQEEFGCEVKVSDRAVAILQIFDDRGHSVSLCYQAVLLGAPGRRVVSRDEKPEAGDLCWFKTPPTHFYPSHRVYGDLLAALDRDELEGGAPIFTQHVGQRDAAQLSPAGAIGADAELT